MSFTTDPWNENSPGQIPVKWVTAHCMIASSSCTETDLVRRAAQQFLFHVQYWDVFLQKQGLFVPKSVLQVWEQEINLHRKEKDQTPWHTRVRIGPRKIAWAVCSNRSAWNELSLWFAMASWHWLQRCASFCNEEKTSRQCLPRWKGRENALRKNIFLRRTLCDTHCECPGTKSLSALTAAWISLSTFVLPVTMSNLPVSSGYRKWTANGYCCIKWRIPCPVE